MAQPPRKPANPPPKQPAPTPESDEPSSRLGWFLGWVVTPTLFFGGIFAGGAYLGANHPEAWVTRSVLWVANIF